MQHSLCIKDTEQKFPQEFLNAAKILFYNIGPLSWVSIAINTKEMFLPNCLSIGLTIGIFLIMKDTSGFTSNTLLIRKQMIP